MSDSETSHRHLGLFPRLIGLALSAGITVANILYGLQQNLASQYVIPTAVATFALSLWVWHFLAQHFIPHQEVSGAKKLSPGAEIQIAWREHKFVISGILILAALFAILSVTVSGFFNIKTVASVAILIAIGTLAVKISRHIAEYKSLIIGIMVLVGLFSMGAMTVDSFASAGNVKSMLIFAAFLGLACTGQTLVALVGGLDLSIPFVIGSSNVALAYIMSLGVPPTLAFATVIILGSMIGLLNGALSFRLQGQALIVSLGVGFAVAGATQISTTIGSQYAGSLFGPVPAWLGNLAAMNGTTFGLNFPAVIAIWIVVSIVIILGLKYTVYGRYLYAIGVSRVSASRVNISERKYWYGVHVISGTFSSFTGALLLGWSGGGFIGIGDPYLFMTIAAVVVGGTSILGGVGGYGFTVIGVLVLQVLTSFLVGLGLEFQWQQFIFGLLILPMVALYARSPHIRTQI